MAVALNHAAYLHHFRREERATQERAEEAIGLCTEQGFAFYLAMANVVCGRMLAGQPQPAAGIQQTLQGLTAWRAAGAVILVPTFLALVGESYGLARQPEEGLALLEEALHLAETNGEHWWKAELYRLKGELLLQQSGPEGPQPEACFRQALEVARHQQAKSLELRAAVSLSRLWRQQGKQAAAHALLAPIYGWFTEGLDTADLREAKALLEAPG